MVSPPPGVVDTVGDRVDVGDGNGVNVCPGDRVGVEDGVALTVG